MEKEIIKLFEKYIDFIQSAHPDTITLKETDEVIQKLYKLKLKYENQQL